MREDRLEQFSSSEQRPRVVDESWIDDDAAAAVKDSLRKGAQLQPVEAGRGASGVAIALNILGVVADTGGAIAFMAVAAKGTKDVWRRIRKTKQSIISISAGAAALLALDSAASRVDSGQARLVAFGAADHDTDSSYSEFDLYWVIVELVDSAAIEFYLVSDKGDVIFAGRAGRPPDPHSRGNEVP